jgi:hypothetical protein
MAVLSKIKSPLAPQSDDEVAKKSDNTKSKKKNDADEEKADKPKLSL